jgi:hypothetical protein
LYDGQDYDDVRVEATLTFGEGGQGSVGLICRYDQDAGWYEFNIYPDQTYALLFGQWLADGVTRYTPMVVAESEHIQPTVNDLTLVCASQVLTPYINGVQLRARAETVHPLAHGGVGVAVASLDFAPVVIAVERVRVAEP